MKRIFANLSPAEESLMTTTQHSKSYLASQKMVKNIFLEFLKTKSLNYDDVNKTVLVDILHIFYYSLRTKTGDHFKSSSFLNIRQSLRTVLKKDKDIDIIYDNDFAKANTTFVNMQKEIKAVGKGCIKHTMEVVKDDLALIINTLDENDPQQLQWLTWTFIMLYFAQRGNEVVSKLKVDDLLIEKDIIKLRNFSTKNHQLPDYQDQDTGGIIVATNNERCPVKIIKLYLSKLNFYNDNLWQRPYSITQKKNHFWYQDAVVGIKTVGSFINYVNTSKTYTNHCLRVTACTLLGDSGYLDGDIQAISGHSSSSSLNIYRRVKDSKKKDMSNTISESIGIINKIVENDSFSSNLVVNDDTKSTFICHEEEELKLLSNDELNEIFKDIPQLPNSPPKKMAFRNSDFSKLVVINNPQNCTFNI